MDIALIISYIIFAVSGSTLIKFGGFTDFKVLFTLPFVNMPFSWVTLIGFICYGISFIVYTILLNRFDLSFISPLTVGLVYVLLMITAFLFFKEQFTVYKIVGSAMILCGIFLIILKK